MDGLRRLAASNEPTLGEQTPLLIVERDRTLGDLIASPAAAAGYGPVRRCDHAAAASWLERSVPGAIVLQLLPGDESCLDLFDAIPDVRGNRPPVVVISPADAVDLRILALERGADDYLLDQFRVDELLVRLDTARRRRELRQGRYLRLGGMLVDMETARFGDGRSWTWLTPKEWRVFAVLLDRRDRTVSRRHLKQVALGGREMSDNALEAMICRLRAKASDLGVRIRASRGVGYMLEPDGAAVAATSVA
jgi:two-component system OmpR family response regulator